MKSFNLKRFLLFLVIPLAAGGIGYLLSGGSMLFNELEQPPLAPPSWVFPVVWTVLYVLMGISSYLVASKYDIGRGMLSRKQTSALRTYFIQLFFNMIWPLIFFRLDLLWVGAVIIFIILILVIITIVKFYRIYPAAAYLMIPYLVWLIFALYLNIGFAVLN